MRVYAKDGTAYDGEPVDCRELMQLHGYTKESPEEKAAAAKAAAVAAKAAAAAKSSAAPLPGAHDDDKVNPAQPGHDASKDAPAGAAIAKG